MTELVHSHFDGGIATITLDSPHNRNALSRGLLSDLHAALDLVAGSGARVVILTHEGPAFCAGADLKERSAGAADSSPLVRAFARLGEMPQPVIAAVSGPVRAGGIGLMAVCDLVVVHSTVTFAFTEVRIGVAPAIISVPILQRCLWSKLAAPFLTGETFDAREARDMGLVTHVADDAIVAARRLAFGILAGAPAAVAATKRLLRDRPDMTAMQQLSASLFAGTEGAEGMAAFLERRSPAWVDPRERP